MEVNKEQAEKCRDLGAAALRRGEHVRAVKMLEKSLHLYPLPGVEALFQHAKKKLINETEKENNSATNNSNTAAHDRRSSSSSNGTSANTNFARSTSEVGADGREYTPEQAEIVSKVLAAKEGGRGAHYRVLNITNTAGDAEIKKAYRKLSLKVHPDKNSAPHADEAFKAVGLAYATLSDSHKRSVYDQSGQEDPDNHGGGMNFRRRANNGGGEMTPEDIFQAFFHGGMPGGGMGPGGVHFYSTGFGPGMHFRAGGPRPRQQQQREQQQQQQQFGMAQMLQLLPVLLILIMSFFSANDTSGEGQYFSLVHKRPFTNRLVTRLSQVKDIPYYVSDKFLYTSARNRHLLVKVEHEVQQAYANYLERECNKENTHQKNLLYLARTEHSADEKEKKMKRAQEFRMSRCNELSDLFPSRKNKIIR